MIIIIVTRNEKIRMDDAGSTTDDGDDCNLAFFIKLCSYLT